MQKPHIDSWIHWIGTMAVWPLESARSGLWRQAAAWQLATVEPASGMAAGWAGAVRAGPAACLSWPFDLARAQHAASVQSGLRERSLLASAAFERRLDLLERMTLGPFARRV